MRRRLLVLLGALIGVVLFVTPGRSQPFSTQIQLALNQLTTGIIPFTAFRTQASSYLNWGTVQGTNGYGLRDNAGLIQFKNSGGTWTAVNAGNGDANASYITRVVEPNLTNETALSGLGTALLQNTTTTGVLSAYAGTTCTNQFVRALSAVGAATCQTIALATDTSGTLLVPRGGTGLASGTSGGILGFTGPTTLASSGALTANAILLGGGAGATPSVLGSLGTTITLLHGNAAGAPTFGQVTLSTEVTGTLSASNGGTSNAFFAVAGPATATKTYTFPNASTTILTTNAAVTAAQGGTGQTTYAIGDLLQATAATTLSKLAAVSTGNALISGGVTTASTWGKIGLTTHVSGTLGVTNGGTGLASYTTGQIVYANSGTSLAGLSDVAVGQVLTSGGVGVAPAYSANPRVTTLLLGANLGLSSVAPTIVSGFGATPTITAGTAAAFRLNISTGGTASAGVIGMPAATTGWNCEVRDLTAEAANAADRRTVQTASSTTTVSVQNQTISTGAALVWTASDILALTCVAF